MAIQVWSSVRMGPVGRKILEVAEFYPKKDQIYVTSGTDGNHGASSHHYGLSYGGSSTAALDFGFGGVGQPARGRDFAKWLYQYSGYFVELIHTTPFNTDNGFYVKSQRRVGPYAASSHRNHVHLALSEKLLDQLLAKLRGTSPDPPPTTGGGIGPIFGWDASDFDHDRGMRAVHIQRAASEGIRFFTHKITEGTRVKHVHAGEKLRAAKDAGIPFLGVYIVPRTPGANGMGSIEVQTDYALSEASRQFPEWKTFPGWFWQVDLEHWQYDKVAARHGVEMARLLRDKTGKATLLYAPKWAYGNGISGSDPLWASDYGQSGASRPFKQMYAGANGRGWGSYSSRIPVVWQYASDAIIGGQRTCDANAFKGSEVDFARLIGVSGPEIPGSGTGEEGNEVVITRDVKPGWAFDEEGSLNEASKVSVYAFPPVGNPGWSHLNGAWLSFNCDFNPPKGIKLRVAVFDGEHWEVKFPVVKSTDGRVPWRGLGEKAHIVAKTGAGITVSVGRVEQEGTEEGSDTPISVLYEAY